MSVRKPLVVIGGDIQELPEEDTISASSAAHASSHTNGTDDIQSATNAQKGLATAAQITAIEANTGKAANVSTNLSEGEATETTVKVASSDGTDATLVSASTSRAGLLTKAKWDEIDAKAPIANPTFTGEIGIGAVDVSETELGILEGATLSTAELNYAKGVTSSIQTQIDSKTSNTVTTPTITAPTEGATDYSSAFTSSAYAVDDSFQGTHDYSHWQISYTSNFASIEFESTSGNLTSWTQALGVASQLAYVRVRHGSDSHLSGWSVAVSFTSPNIYIQTPTNTAPTNTATDIGETPTLTADTFTCVNGSDTHASSSWQVATDSGFASVIYESLADAGNLESIDVSAAELSVSTTYYWRVKYTGTTYGDSSYSTAFSFTTKSTFSFYIGTAGAQDFGVAPSSESLTALGLVAMTGTATSGHGNYGNYTHTATSSILCHIPKFFYRVGNASSSQYATYGANALDIVGTDTYANETAANAAGYVMPRAFIDGGSEKAGFFIDKYKCSPSDNKGVSVKNGVPISLTTTDIYTRSNGMTSCVGQLLDAVTLSRARGTGFNNASIFMMGAIAILSVAHAQAATATTNCAWYDSGGTTNFPKGCNSALADTNDSGVTYTTAGDSGDANKPQTGSGSPFAKTTHNGQNSGVCDLNGGIYEVALGLTNYGTTAIEATAIATDTIYVLKQATALKNLTAGWDGTTDAWGNATHLATLYDSVTSPHALGSTTGTVYWGSGSNAVFSASASGVNRDLCGFIPKDNSASDATGTNQFGNDYCYRYNRQNMFAHCCGSWVGAANAGLFCREFIGSRTRDSLGSGFRASAYV